MRLAARLARRDARRHPWRALLVALLVGLPVAAVAGGSSLLRTMEQTADERLQARLAGADALVEGADPDSVPDLPAGVRVAVERTPGALLETDGRVMDVSATDLGPGEPLSSLELVDGRQPQEDGEVAVSVAVLRDGSLAVGDRVSFSLLGDRQPGAGRTARGDARTAVVVGVVEDPTRLSRRVVAVGGLPERAEDERVRLLVDAAGDEARARDAVEALADQYGDHGVLAPGTPQAPPDGGGAGVPFVFVGGALGLVVAAIVASAALSVGVQRRLRELGLLAAAGASPGTGRKVVVATAITQGGAGAVAGVLAGVAAAALIAPRLEEAVVDRRLDGLDLAVVDVAGALLLGLTAALVAAVVPARAVARLDVRAALAGRRPVPGGTRRTTAIGAVLALGGFGLVISGATGFRPRAALRLGGATGTVGAVEFAVVIVGAVAVVLGMAALSPGAMAALERLAGRLRAAPRMVVRDLARNRQRTAPAVAAVMAALSLPIAIWMFTVAEDQRAEQRAQLPHMLDDQLVLRADPRVATDERAAERQLSAAEAAIRAERDVAVSAGLSVAGDSGAEGGERVTVSVRSDADPGVPGLSSSQLGIVDDPTSIAALGVSDVETAAETLADGGVVAVGEGTAPDGTAEIVVARQPVEDDDGLADAAADAPAAEAEPQESDEELRNVAVVEVAGQPHYANPAFLVVADSELARGLPSEAAAAARVLRLSEPLSSPGEIDRLRAAATEAGPLGMQAPDVSRDPVVVARWAALAGSALVALGVVAVALGLQATESRADLATLRAVGASPHSSRVLRGLQAAGLAALGGALAVPAGVLPTIGVLVSRPGYVLPVPWPAILVALVAVPAAAGLAAFALTAPVARAWSRSLPRPGA